MTHQSDTSFHRRHHGLARAITTALVTAAVLAGGLVAVQGLVGSGAPDSPNGGEPAAIAGTASTTSTVVATTTTTSTTTTTTIPITTSSTAPSIAAAPTTVVPVPAEPIPVERYLVPQSEVAVEAKQFATDIAVALTTYDGDTDHIARLGALDARSDVEVLAGASAPLIHAGSWSRGEAIYPQLGGLANAKASVMVVTRQTVGDDDGIQFSVVRTLDIRVIEGESGWLFDSLSSAGGTFEDLDALRVAHDVASDPRIELPDSARLDILAGEVDPTLLEVMLELADRTPYAATVLATGHPIHVFETDRTSHHTIGQAVDIYRIGFELVVDDHDPDSETRETLVWLYDHPDVIQVGGPWDLDGEASRRSFTNTVHQDHIHLAVRAAN